MTSDAAVIKAAFSEWQMIKTRKVLQLRFEVPIEQGAVVLQMLGMPLPHEEKWCAIALLDPDAMTETARAGAKLLDDLRDHKLRAPDNTIATGATPNPSEREPTKALLKNIPAASGEAAGTAPGGKGNASFAPTPGSTASQQAQRYRNASEMQRASWRASILCGKPEFQEWFCIEAASPQAASELAAIEMRKVLGITSRSEIGINRSVYERFIALETQYLQDVGRLAESR